MSMDPATVLEVRNVFKRYARNDVTARSRLREVFSRSLLGRESSRDLKSNEFWAIQNISFSLRQGEAIGIIGLNGSGKTTLLRILSGQLMPDQGEVQVVRQSASIIYLTAGFHTGLSGRQNIYLRSAMLGRTRAEVRETEAGIIEFAELGEFIDAPLRTYSAGMSMRLAFAISVFSNPRLLIIDEVLSVGDFRFRMKCLERIRELRDAAGFVLVSHAMGDISRFCDHVLVLDKGKIAFQGPPKEAIDHYQSTQASAPAKPGTVAPHFAGDVYSNEEVISNVEHYWADSDGRPIEEVQQGRDLYFRCRFRLNYVPRNLVIGVPVWTGTGVYVTGFSTEHAETQFSVTNGGTTDFTLKIRELPFNADTYVSAVAISDGPEFLFRQHNPKLEVKSSKYKYWGVVSLDYEWSKS